MSENLVKWTRRQFGQSVAMLALSGAIRPSIGAMATAAVPPVGFSLYGMRSVPVSEALRVCAEIGYECVELAVMPDWPCAPQQLSGEKRREIRQQLTDRGLKLAALMENLPLAVEGEAHQKNLDRLKQAAQLAHDLVPDSTPILETILGGSPDKWQELKPRFIERLRDWAKVAEESQAIITIKAHVAGALHLPNDTVELVRTINSKWLQAVYDFSHFQLRGLTLKDSWSVLAEQTRFIHVKDARGEPGKFQFLLPGEGTTDYAELFRLLAQSRYAGPVVVEVSAQISNKPGYDPLAAAKQCWPVLRDARRLAAN